MLRCRFFGVGGGSGGAFHSQAWQVRSEEKPLAGCGRGEGEPEEHLDLRLKTGVRESRDAKPINKYKEHMCIRLGGGEADAEAAKIKSLLNHDV